MLTIPYYLIWWRVSKLWWSCQWNKGWQCIIAACLALGLCLWIKTCQFLHISSHCAAVRQGQGQCGCLTELNNLQHCCCCICSDMSSSKLTQVCHNCAASLTNNLLGTLHFREQTELTLLRYDM